MNPTNDSRDPVEQLAEEFLERLRSGESVSAEDYAAAHPGLAEEILDLFPTMRALEKLGDDDSSESSPGENFRRPTQLGDLRLVREIGRGGMGIVYEAEQESLGRRVAVKLLPERALFDTKRLERFRREARTAAALQHPSIVPIYGVGEQDGLHYLTMQLIEGAGLDVLAMLVGRRAGVIDPGGATEGPAAATLGATPAGVDETLSAGAFADNLADALLADDFAATSSADYSTHEPLQPADSGEAPTIALSEELARSAGRRSSLLVEEAVDAVDARAGVVGDDYFRSVAKIGVQAAEALAYAHARGTLHRDIKPANLLLDRRGNVWITDFGLAKAMDPLTGDDGLSRSGELVGTLRYMAPEQLHGEASPLSDLYSLGLTLYELVAWRPAFVATAPSELIRKITSETPAAPRKLNPELPVDLETIVLKAIARDPADRYQSGDDLAADLRRFMEGIPVAAERQKKTSELWQWTRNNPAVAGLAAAVVLLGTTTLLAMGVLLGGPPPTPPVPQRGPMGGVPPLERNFLGRPGPLADGENQPDEPGLPPRPRIDRPRRERFGPGGPRPEELDPEGRRPPRRLPPGEFDPLFDSPPHGGPPHGGPPPHDPLGLGPGFGPPPREGFPPRRPDETGQE